MFKRLLLVVFLIPVLCRAQENRAIAYLNENIQKAKTDEQKIQALGELAEYYYAYRLEKQADSVQQVQLSLAKLSINKDLVLKTLFDHSITSITNWSNKETFDRALDFLNKGLEYARETKQHDYEALAYIRKATILRKRGQYERAIEEASHAFSALENTLQDSLKAVLYLELGDIMLAKDDAVTAYKNFNKAYEIGYGLKNRSLQSETFRHYAALYNRLNNKQLAEEYLLKSVGIDRSGNQKSLLLDYIDLSRYVEKKVYIEKVLALSEALKLFRYQISGKQLMLAYYMVIEKNATAALQYLNENNDLRQSFLNKGESNLLITVGNCYKFGNKPDSALYYFLKAENEVKQSMENVSQIAIFQSIGDCYKQLKRPNEAIQYYEKAYLALKQGTSLATDSSLTNNISKLYESTGDYKKAFYYKNLYHESKEKLQSLADARQVVLLEVERVERQYEKDQQEAALKVIQTRNLQYMGISVVIATVFFFMILLGMFPMSKFTIRLLSFFAFICLFEFIVLLIDSYLHHVTHGEPLKIWLVKIFIIALLVPVQHYLEHMMAHFIESRRLLLLRQRFAHARFWARKKKPTPLEADVTT